ncbi:3643_t:CDS:2, partial [Acaulospora colombiana]
MKEKTAASASSKQNSQSFLGGFAKKKRLIGLLIGLSTALFLWNQFSDASLMSWLGMGNEVRPFDEFQGMLYYLTKSDKLLPAQLDGSEVQESSVWSDGTKLSPAQWETRLAEMYKQYPV